MFEIVILIYTVWAVYSGYKIVSGRSEWLDRRAPINMVAKAVASIIVGYLFGAFYFIFLLLRVLGFISKM